MSADFLAALCLVMVLEGAIVFIAPQAWKRAVAQLSMLTSARLRLLGLVFMLIGWLSLQWLR
ncbi:MAG: DUF2065 domain-containing protein [Deltaproteobacteria bacterium CG17_big_fil_post_rev_8_21_14_2_50_63_7]|nr:MAG: DUF2065 domain-containing protein [Deltaproteobacteria bacterium CG17_big_fil_post_rev_8_21_14_2_50_63_7]